MKLLLFLALVFIVLWILRKVQAARQGGRSPPASHVPESMVKCAYCGVNQPVSESILTNGRYYCCNTHLQEAESRDP